MTARRTIICLLAVPLAVALNGCIAHDVRVDAAAEPSGPDATRGMTAIGATATPSPPGPPLSSVISGPLPQEVQVSAWRAPEEGGLLRAEQTASTPLPWWQRFPFDLATDLLPYTVHAETDVTLAMAPVATRTPADLQREATSAGYGGALPAALSAAPSAAHVQPAASGATSTP